MRPWSPWFAGMAYAVSRTVTAIFTLILSGSQAAAPRSEPWFHVAAPMPAHPSYWGMTTNWDGQWFKSIALHGYPVPSSTQSVPAEYAFYPAYPLLVRSVMFVTGGSFEVVAGLVSLLLGLVGVLMVHYLFAISGRRAVGDVAVLALCFAPAAAVFQFAYSESLALVAVAGGLIAVHRRRWLLVAPLALLLGMSRGIAGVFFVIVVVVVVADLRSDGRGRSRIFGAAVAIVATGLAAFVWPLTLWVMTGSPTTYFRSLGQWFSSERTFGGWIVGPWRSGLPIVSVAAVAALVGLLFVCRPGAGTGWGLVPRAWTATYATYLAAFTPMSSSFVRYATLALAPTLPMLRLRAESRLWTSWLARAGLCVSLALLQWLWLRHWYVYGGDPAQPFP